jgi:hypothetical protein
MMEIETLSSGSAITADVNADFNVPVWAKMGVFMLDLSAVAGTTPIMDCKFQYNDTVGSEFIDVDAGAMLQLTAADSQAVMVIGGPETDSTGQMRMTSFPLIHRMRAVIDIDRTTGNETYTYTLAVWWLA